MTATSERGRRTDAQRNRESILVAARELFAESAEVPRCEVARKAGVGQATLYRNFPDHRDLVAALLDEYLGRFDLVSTPVHEKVPEEVTVGGAPSAPNPVK
jgi:AcrR family transcriptional regulator